MSTRIASHSADNVSPEEARNTLQLILNSKQFVNAHKRKKFLRVVCDFYLEGRANELNEYVLAYDVFGRDSTYNSASDPIVRVVAHEIRKKLEAYYQGDGAKDSIRLDIPAGSYQPLFYRHSVETDSGDLESAALATPSATPERKKASLALVTLSLALVVFATAAVLLLISNRELRREVAEARAPRDISTYGELWEPFLRDPVPPLVVLSNPTVPRLSNPSDRIGVDKNSIALSPEAVEALKGKTVTNPEIVMSNTGSTARTSGDSSTKVVVTQNQPRLILSANIYTGLGEAIGLSRLTDLFRTANRNILLKQSRTLSADDLKSHNVILLGGVWVNEWSAKLPGSEDFHFSTNGTIENRSPRPGEETAYIPQFDGDTGALMVDYGLITVRPNISDQNKVMVLAGVYSQGTEAAVEYLTNSGYLSQFNQRLRQLSDAGAPRFFQALLKVGVENGIPTTISVLALHEMRQSGP